MKDYSDHRESLKNLLDHPHRDLVMMIFDMKPGECIYIDEVEYLCCSVYSHIDFAFKECNGVCVRVNHDQKTYEFILSATTPTTLNLGGVLKCIYRSDGLFKWTIQDTEDYIKGNK